jgi:hypothetical protein
MLLQDEYVHYMFQKKNEPMDLHRFIVTAKAASYIGGAPHSARPSRRASHDITFEEGAFSYLDSYYGGTNFIGQETVWHEGEPVWAMNYHGRVLDPDRIDGSRAGAVIKDALSALYREGRFLGGFHHEHGFGLYLDESEGDHLGFRGVERILVDGVEAYRLDYHGGRILP